jgi:hypothetical protein
MKSGISVSGTHVLNYSLMAGNGEAGGADVKLSKVYLCVTLYKAS